MIKSIRSLAWPGLAGVALLIGYAASAAADNSPAAVDPASRLAPGGHDVSLSGQTIHYDIDGHGPLLVVQAPAWGIGSNYLRNGLAPLTKEFTVLTFDPPGSGASGQPVDGRALSNSAQINVLESLREYWGVESIDLLGHSNGGALAIGYAERYPSRVRKLILVGTQLFGVWNEAAEQKFRSERANDSRYKAALERLDHLAADNDEAFTQWFKQIAPWYFYDPEKHMPAFLETLTRPLSSFQQRAPRPIDAVPGLDEQHYLDKIKARTLIIEGREDPVCTVDVSELIHAGIPQSQLLIYEHTGHFVWIEAADRFFADAIRFLKQ